MSGSETTIDHVTSVLNEESSDRRIRWQQRFPRLRCYLINGALVLWGVVANDAIRLQAEELAWQNFAADTVVNQIQIEKIRK